MVRLCQFTRQNTGNTLVNKIREYHNGNGRRIICQIQIGRNLFHLRFDHFLALIVECEELLSMAGDRCFCRQNSTWKLGPIVQKTPGGVNHWHNIKGDGNSIEFGFAAYI